MENKRINSEVIFISTLKQCGNEPKYFSFKLEASDHGNRSPANGKKWEIR